MSTLAVGTIKSVSSAAPVFQNTSGTEKGQLAKAWVSFDSTGTFTVNDSFNVSSVDDNGTGDFTVNFSTAMANVNYAIGTGFHLNQHNGTSHGSCYVQNIGTSSFDLYVCNDNNGTQVLDKDHVSAVVFGD